MGILGRRGEGGGDHSLGVRDHSLGVGILGRRGEGVGIIDWGGDTGEIACYRKPGGRGEEMRGGGHSLGVGIIAWGMGYWGEEVRGVDHSPRVEDHSPGVGPKLGVGILGRLPVTEICFSLGRCAVSCITEISLTVT